MNLLGLNSEGNKFMRIPKDLEAHLITEIIIVDTVRSDTICVHIGCILNKVNPNNHAVMIESTVYGRILILILTVI
jgi:hypothetical protein